MSRGLVPHNFGGRKEVYVALLERVAAGREEELRPPLGRGAPARVADTVSRRLDWTEANQTIYLGWIAPREDIADPDLRRAVVQLTAPIRHLNAARLGVLGRCYPVWAAFAREARAEWPAREVSARSSLVLKRTVRGQSRV